MAKTNSESWVADQGSSTWLQHDPRSAIAMLRGPGDGREKLYNRFRAWHRGSNPAVTDENLIAAYAVYAAKMDAKVRRRNTVPVQEKQSQGALLALAAFLCLGRLVDGHLIPQIGAYLITQ